MRNKLISFVLLLVLPTIFSGLFAQQITNFTLQVSTNNRPVRDKSMTDTDGRFRVHYNNTVDESYAIKLLEYLQVAYSRVCIDRGWTEPLYDGGIHGDEWDFYIGYIDSVAARGTTKAENIDPNNENASGYCEIADELTDSQLRVTAAHEFIHLCQFAYTIKDGLNNANGFWFYENCAVWLAEEIYNYEYKDYTRFFDMENDPLHKPELNIDYTNGSYYAYGGFLFPKFLSEWCNNENIIKSIRWMGLV